MKPVIGITPSFDRENGRITLPLRYFHAISACGGIPLLLSVCAEREDSSEVIRRLDGILFSGGADIHPNRYGEEILPECGVIDEQRDEAELTLYEILKEHRLPVLGICRGIQVLNVAEGGTLYQHIPNHRDSGMHSVTAEQNSLIEATLGSRFAIVNSYHHQAVKSVAPTCKVTARADDGTAEAIECPAWGRFWLGVQWHPECLFSDDSASKSIFEAFIRA